MKISNAKMMKIQIAKLNLFIFIFLILGCTSIKPSVSSETLMAIPVTFSHASFNRVLQRFVDPKGMVDYTSLQQNSRDLDDYYHLIASYSPDSHPDLFPSEDHKLAYWINAYNATAIKTVITYYPISSVLDVKPPAVFFFLTDKSGFFVFQRLTYGGKTTSLYYLQNGVIRERFQEPRIHFALNCAALGCPRLPKKAFTGEDLQRQLDKEIRKFLSEERNFKIDHEEKTIYLSSIFKWYEKDFLDGIQDRFPNRKGTLLDYVTLYLPAEKAYELNKAGDRYKIDFVPYDWGLNDQK